MQSYPLEVLATDQNFDEEAYLSANPDVAGAVQRGELESARSHFDIFGQKEGRKLQLASSIIEEAKRRKLARIEPILRKDMPHIMAPGHYDFLSAELRSEFNIIDTDAVSSHSYDAYAMEIIRNNEEGLVLDCGAGKRPEYFENVINFEIVAYDTTDVRGVGEVLPFVDESFDAVISIAVLEHVKDPFLCAREIARVLKPGGSLMCCAPFLQPLHGYPHHYYNMTGQGLENLFSDVLETDRITVYESIYPIWSLTWIIQSWAAGLEEEAKKEFLQLKLADLMESGEQYLDRSFVKKLSEEKNLELASGTVLFAHKNPQQ